MNKLERQLKGIAKMPARKRFKTRNSKRQARLDVVLKVRNINLANSPKPITTNREERRIRITTRRLDKTAPPPFVRAKILLDRLLAIGIPHVRLFQLFKEEEVHDAILRSTSQTMAPS